MKSKAVILSLTLTLTLLLTSALSIPLGVNAYSNPVINDAKKETQKAFEALVEAYNAGGNVSNLAAKLNDALTLLSQAEELMDRDVSAAEAYASEAKRLASSVVEEAHQVKEEGLMQRQTATIITVITITALLTVGALVYLYGPDILWRLWVWLRRNYRVKVRASSKRAETPFTMEHACAVILAITLIISTFTAYQFFLGERIVEPFSELGILGHGMKLAEYPKEVIAGETITLYIYVGNHMGKPMYYAVLVKLGDNETAVNPAPVQPFIKLERVLLHNENWTSPINITLAKPGLNQRIIFELWMYNETMGQTQYHERWGQIWVNVTSPP
jgi:uncharacterized membrane protein